MATPSTSTASPPAAFMRPPPARSDSVQSLPSDSSGSTAKDVHSHKAIERSHLSSVARSLRTRLSYASYKAAHNLPHATLLDLEKHPPPGPASTLGRNKRKAASNNNNNSNYYNNPATQGGPPAGGAPAPKRTHYPNVPSQPSGSSAPPNGSDILNGYGRDGQSLFTAILAPPPTSQARTIMNPLAPPVNPPVRPQPASPRAPKGARLISEGPRGGASRKESAKAPEKGKRKADPKGKQKEVTRRGKKSGGDVVDMEAAAALAGLMKRPSMTSDPGSDGGSTRSYSHYPAGTTRGPMGEAPRKIPRLTSPPDNLGASAEGDGLAPPIDVPDRQGTTTPGPRPTDDEAADLMLYLATSPSPARKSRNDRDEAAFRALGTMPRPSKALFRPGQESSQGSSQQLPTRMQSTSPQRSSGLARNAPGYTSSISSIGSELEPRAPIARPASTNPPQLMPPAPLPAAPSSAPASPQLQPQEAAASSELFNVGDFINSPPANPSHGTPRGGLRMDVGRRLFEEQQHRFGPSSRSSEDAGIHH